MDVNLKMRKVCRKACGLRGLDRTKVVVVEGEHRPALVWRPICGKQTGYAMHIEVGRAWILRHRTRGLDLMLGLGWWA